MATAIPVYNYVDQRKKTAEAEIQRMNDEQEKLIKEQKERTRQVERDRTRDSQLARVRAAQMARGAYGRSDNMVTGALGAPPMAAGDSGSKTLLGM